SGLTSTALGTQATANATNSVALGNGSIANVANTVSFGTAGSERRLTNLAAGINPTDGVNMSQLTALDLSVDTRITDAFANFTGCARTSVSSFALAAAADPGCSHEGAGGATSLAIGLNADAAGVNTVALGSGASATGTNSIAMGAGASAVDAVAVGTGATASNNGAAFGNGASATGTNSAAFGPNSSATAPNSVALGSGSIADQANTVSVGSAGNERRITNVATGAAPTDAVNMQQFQAGLSSTNSRMDSLNSRIDTVDQQARRGIAAAAALAPTMMPSKNGKTTVALSTAFYRGEAALSVGVAHRLNTSTPTVVFGSYANGGGSEQVGRVGIAAEF
ncbi:MAG: YadA-like family protein, partial [Pseudolabrys sp.]|nr:YadA-like family protein [Pseudolabrys sp.]